MLQIHLQTPTGNKGSSYITGFLLASRINFIDEDNKRTSTKIGSWDQHTQQASDIVVSRTISRRHDLWDIEPSLLMESSQLGCPFLQRVQGAEVRT